jgi:RNA polymerase sigma-70 factor (ECF subfamily)
MKDASRATPLSDEAEGGVEKPSEHELGALEIIELASHLPPKQRLAFLLRDVLEFTSREAGVVSGMSEVAVRVDLFRARRRLRHIIVGIDDFKG